MVCSRMRWRFDAEVLGGSESDWAYLTSRVLVDGAQMYGHGVVNEMVIDN